MDLSLVKFMPSLQAQSLSLNSHHPTQTIIDKAKRAVIGANDSQSENGRSLCALFRQENGHLTDNRAVRRRAARPYLY